MNWMPVPWRSPNDPSYGRSIEPVQDSGQPSSISFTVFASTPAAGPPRAPLEQAVDLLHPAVAVPPERRHHARRQTALVVEPRGRRGAGPPRPTRPATPVMPSAWSSPLRDPDRRHPVLDRVGRDVTRPERVRGALLQAAGRRAVGLAHVVAVPRVGRARVDARRAPSAGVFTHARVRVGVHQEDGPVGHDRVEVLPDRARPRGTSAPYQPAAHDPRRRRGARRRRRGSARGSRRGRGGRRGSRCAGSARRTRRGRGRPGTRARSRRPRAAPRRRPTRSRTSASVPTATMRSPSTATASGVRRRARDR